MNKNTIIAAVVVAIVFASAGYYFGKSSAGASTASGALGSYAARAGRTGGLTGGATAGGGFGGGTSGTIIATSDGSFTIQLPSSTSTSATTGTKIILVDNATQVQELQSVPASTLKNGQSVTVTGSANSDGSITATNVMVRPATAASRGTPSTGQ